MLIVHRKVIEIVAAECAGGEIESADFKSGHIGRIGRKEDF